MNKKMDNIVNECLERVVFRGESKEEVLKSYPDYATELKPLLEMALAVKRVAAISPREEFRARARYEFHQALAAKRSEKRSFLTNLMPRWAAALSIALAVLLASGGTVAAASNSMPDSVLYPVKLATEQARMTITFSEIGKAELYAELTDKRVDEIVYLANKGDSARVSVQAHKLDDSVDKLADLTQAAYGNRNAARLAAPAQAPSAKEGAPQPIASATQLPMVGSGAPATDKSVTGAAAPPAVSSTPRPQFGITAAEKPEAADTSGKAAAKENKEPKLKTILTANAIKHPAQLRAALERVPESAKQDILRSIAITAASYEKAIRSIDEDER